MQVHAIIFIMPGQALRRMTMNLPMPGKAFIQGQDDLKGPEEKNDCSWIPEFDMFLFNRPGRPGERIGISFINKIRESTCGSCFTGVWSFCLPCS